MKMRGPVKGRLLLRGGPGRAAEARAMGHAVQCANFLETVPSASFDHVVMNPPFFGTHYARHVEHALRYLKPGEAPEARFHLGEDGKATVYAYCNLHGLWKAEL